MRMWMINPEHLCNRHLLGEHGELHKHLPGFKKKHSIAGRVHPVVLIEPASMMSRHDALAKEMIRRGMNHRSPLEYDPAILDYLPEEHRFARVSIRRSYKDLHERCDRCMARYAEWRIHG